MAAQNATIVTAATSFIKSYATAMHLAHSNPPTPLTTIGAKLGSHYLPTFTSFSLGAVYSVSDTMPAIAMVQGHLEHLANSGVGCDVREVKSRVEVVSNSSALCWITWKIVPAEGWEGDESEIGQGGWEWENCYFYRRNMDGTEGFEGVIADGEIEGLLKHIPNFFG
jgi:hypothetical protein